MSLTIQYSLMEKRQPAADTLKPFAVVLLLTGILSLSSCPGDKKGGSPEESGRPAAVESPLQPESYLTSDSKPSSTLHRFSDFRDYEDFEAAAETIVSQMTDIEVVGQLFMFGYAGKVAGPDILKWVGERKIGSIKIFGWNGTDLKEICRSVKMLQREAENSRLEIPLFIATDQEGGWVRHIKAESSITPGNMAIAASGLMEDSYLSSYYIAQELRYLGINMNFAPTVDVYLDRDSKIIGSRAFSEDPIQTANLSVAFFRGHEALGVVATAKHFPGHGNSSDDSHGRLPVIESDREFLYEQDLVPYLFLIREGIPAIMIGHISFPKITGNNDPATLSPAIIQGLLRQELGYEGLVITDDLNMAGMRKKGVNTGDKSLEALKAGNDMVLISKKLSAARQYEVQWQSVMNEYRNNPDFRKQARESAVRVVKTKLQYIGREKSVPIYPEEEKILSQVPSPEGKAFFFDQACRSITRISSRSVLLMSDDSVLLAGYYRDFFAEGKRRLDKSSSFNLLGSLRKSGFNGSLNEVIRRMSDKKHLIIEVSDPQSLKMAKAAKAAGLSVLAISSYNPGLATELEEMDHALALYGSNSYSCKAGFAALLGDFNPVGRLPFSRSE